MTTANFSISNLRSRIQSGIDSRWMNGIVVIAYPNGELNAIPGSHLTDISYTEERTVLSSAMDAAEAEEFLSQTDEDILSWAEEAYEQA